MEQKIPLSRTLPLYMRHEIKKEIAKRGMALPGIVKAVNGAIVTVNFQVSGANLPTVEMPLFGPEYIRYPVQIGDKGVCFPADVYIGAMSGLGTGEADFTQQANLSTLVFFPIGNANWSAVDANAVTIYGPNGVVQRDTGSGTVSTLTPSGWTVDSASGALSFSFNGATFSMGSSGITLAFSGNEIVISAAGITIMGKNFLTHMHTLVTTGTSDSGPVA